MTVPGQPIRRELDFFSDLGGHSLFAARITSTLRQDPRFAQATVADIYNHRRIGLIAEALSAGMIDTGAAAADRPFIIHSAWRRWRCGIAQGLAIPFLVLLTMAQWLAPFFVYHFHTGDPEDSIAYAVLMSALAFVVAIGLNFVIAWVGRRLIGGRLKPGSYPLWASPITAGGWPTGWPRPRPPTCTLLLWNELAQLAGRPAGIVWMQGAALCWALGTIWMRRARLTLPPEALVVWMMAWSAAVIAVLAVALEPPQTWHFSAGVWVSLAWAVLINYGAAQVIWFSLARALPPATSAMSVMAVPLIGTLSAPLIVGEWPRWQDLAAMVCVVVAIGAVLLKRD